MIRQVLLPLLLTLGAASAAGAAERDVSRDELIAFADRFDAAQIAKDGAALEEMVAEELVFIESSGKRQDKKGFIEGWVDPALTFEPIMITDRVVVPLGPDAGVVGGDVVLKGKAGGEAFAAHIRFADTFRRIDGKWRAVHIQVTKVP